MRLEVAELFDMTCFTQALGTRAQKNIDIRIVNIMTGSAFYFIVIDLNAIVETVGMVDGAEVGMMRDTRPLWLMIRTSPSPS